jgi:ABC-type transporter Mla subunit MlaD
MRRIVFLFMSLLEFAVAMVLIVFGFQLPSRSEIDTNFGKAERVSQDSSAQVKGLRDQVRDMRRPELRDMALQLQTQSKTVTTTLKSQNVDFDQVRVISNSLGDVANGLEGFGEALDGDNIRKIGDGFGATADLLDEQVAPSAGRAADSLDKSTALLSEDAKKLSELLRQAPPDLRATREVHDSLARFSEGLDRLNTLLSSERIGAMREGFKGLDTSLSTGADQVDRLSGYHYPIVTMRGLKPDVEQRKFWPDGDKIAEGMRKAAAGARAGDEEMALLEKDLPKLRDSLEESRKVADKTREALALALKQQDKVEVLLKSVPETTARLAEELPRLTAELSRVMRQTERLRDVAKSLRVAQKGVEVAVAKWPELRTSLSRSATLLRMLRTQLDSALERRQEYEAALKQSILLADTFATLLPSYVDSLDLRLQQQEQGLDDLGHSLDQVSNTLPVYARTTNDMIWAARLLSWLMAGIVALHGISLVMKRSPLSASR